jgi:hypothetical protein
MLTTGPGPAPVGASAQALTHFASVAGAELACELGDAATVAEADVTGAGDIANAGCFGLATTFPTTAPPAHPVSAHAKSTAEMAA